MRRLQRAPLWMNCEKRMWGKYGEILMMSSQFWSPIGGYANPPRPHPSDPAALGRTHGGACHGSAERMEFTQRVFGLFIHARHRAAGAICGSCVRKRGSGGWHGCPGVPGLGVGRAAASIRTAARIVPHANFEARNARPEVRRAVQPGTATTTC